MLNKVLTFHLATGTRYLILHKGQMGGDEWVITRLCDMCYLKPCYASAHYPSDPIFSF